MPSGRNGEKKMQSGDHGKDKSRNVPLSLNKNKMQKNENKKRIAPITSAVKEKKMRSTDSMEMKMHNRDNKEKKRSAPSVLPKENKFQKLTNTKKENKRKEPSTPFNKEKKMRANDKDKKVGSDDKGKEKKIQGDKDKKVQSGDKNERKAPLTFFKFICNNFKKFLLIPPMIAPKLEDMTNHLVYLKDSEGKPSKIRLSVVDGSLAFHHGWDNFVSDHLIKWGDFLLFEYTGMSTFSVRVFGMDSCERLHFNVERQGGRKNQKESNTSHYDLVSSHRGRNSEDIDDRHYVSGEYPMSKEPKTTVDGYITNNGEIASCNLVAESMNTASETHCMTANTKEVPSRVVSGVGREPSAALDNEEGNLAIGECKTNNISTTCSKEKTRRSEIILITDTAPLTQENDDTVKLTTFSHHKENRSMMRESEPEVATPTKCTEIHDSDEDLRKQERYTIQLECTTVVNKCPSNSKVNTNGNVCRKYEAPGGSLCLEKWKKGVVSGRAALDGTGLIGPEKPQTADKKLVGSCGAMGLNPVEQQLGSDSTDSCVQPMLGRISKSGHSRTEMNHSVNGKGGKGATVQLQTKKEQLEPVGSIVSKQRNTIPVCANHAIPHQSEHQFSQQEDGKSSNCVTPVTLLPVKAEVLELDDHCLLKINFQFCIPSTTQTWLELPKSLSNAVRCKGRQDQNVIMFKDPMKRLWPVFYHEKPVFVGFTTGWKPFVTANNLQIGDHCELLEELDEEEIVYRVQITKK